MQTQQSRALRLGVLFLVMALLPVEAMAAVGRIYYTSGGVYIERGTEKVPATKDSLLESGDVIVTEFDGRAQWRMADDSFFAIRPDSRFRIDEYQEPAKGGAGGKAFYSLLKGGFRNISGLIGKSDPAAYQVKSPVATLGIRGTDHTHVLCQGDCGWAGSNIADGLYTRVDEGSSFLSNPEGGLEVKGGQYAETLSAPKLVDTAPTVFLTWEVDFRIDIGLIVEFEHEGSLRIEPVIEPCLPVPSPNQPCP